MRKILRDIKNTLLGRNNYDVKRLIANFLPQNPVIIEAGAHIGTDTIEMLKIWPHATIHSFEPVPKIYKKLLDNTKGRKNIFTYPYALGSESGVSDIFISSGGSDASSSLLQPKEHKIDYPDVHFLESNQIKIITLDQWASDNQIPRVDFAWLDMQGYELSALKSGQTVLKKMQAVYTEVFLKELYKDAPLYAEIKLWFESQGFKVEIEEMASDSVGNVLFIRK